MHANPLVRTALWILAAALLLAAPAQSQVVVQYTATLTSGFGDGPTPTPNDPAGIPDTANNGFPACAATISLASRNRCGPGRIASRSHIIFASSGGSAPAAST